MGATERGLVGDAPLRCVKCGEVIGVYEPLVSIVSGVAHRTSRAAEPEIVDARTAYHEACWDPTTTPSGEADH